MIVTDTPEKQELFESTLKRKIKQNGTHNKCSRRKLFDSAVQPPTIENEDDLSCRSSSSDEAEIMEFDVLPKEPSVGDYVLTEFQGKTKLIYYVGEVIKDKDGYGDTEVSFMRRVKNSDKFAFPEIPDEASVNETDVKMILPQPKQFGSTKRQNSYRILG